MVDPIYSICMSSNRPQYWNRLYESYQAKSKNVPFEIISVGPCPPDFPLPSNFKYIATKNIKPTQCFEIAIRNVSGEFVGFIGDDCILHRGTLDTLYNEYKQLCDNTGNDKIVLLPAFFYGRTEHSTPYHRHGVNSPMTSLCGVFMKKKWFDEIGYLDRNFLGVYWDIDWCMRFYEFGGKIIKTHSTTIREIPEMISPRLHRLVKPVDRGVVNSFWVRNLNEAETVPSDSCWCFYGKKQVVSKYRNKPLEPFTDDKLLEKTQGVSSFGNMSWE